MMDRRSFLCGLATSVVAAVPLAQVVTAASAEVTAQTWVNEWVKAVYPILYEVSTDILIYGQGATRRTEVFPYLERVPPIDFLRHSDAVVISRDRPEDAHLNRIFGTAKRIP